MSKKLHYDFVNDKSLIARTGPTLVCTRASVATYFDDAGVRQIAAANEPRFDHLPVAPFTSLGLLVEETRINLFLNSDVPVTQGVTTTAQDYTVWMEGAGSVTLSGTGSGVATAGNPVTVTCTAGTLTLTLAGGPDTVQVEAGAFPTSYIPTVASPVTRNNDIINTTDLDWCDTSVGSYYLRAQFNVQNDGVVLFQTDNGGTVDRIRPQAHGFGQERGTWTVTVDSVTQCNLSLTSGTWQVGIIEQAAYCYAEDDFEYYQEGSRVGTGDQSGTMVGYTCTRLTVGASSTGAAVETITGYIAELRYYNERLDNDTLEDMSNGVFPPEGRSNYLAMDRRLLRKGGPKKIAYPKPKTSMRDLQ